MGVARIVGHTVRVTAQDSAVGKIYSIRGDGASRLHAYCTQTNLAVSPLIEDSFYVTEETIQNEQAFPDINRLYICNGIIEAALEHDIRHC